MSSFSASLQAFKGMILSRQREVFVGTLGELHHSIVDGSPLTGAPGQPVDTSDLRTSWQEEYPEEWVGRTVTNVAYALAVEEGVQEAHTRRAHDRRAYTRSDGVEVRATTVREAEVPRREIVFRSAVGGAHSVKLTRAGFRRVVDAVTNDVVSGGGA